MVWKDYTDCLNFNLHSSGKTQGMVVQENAGNPVLDFSELEIVFVMQSLLLHKPAINTDRSH